MQQRTPEWFQARAGLVTASRFADVMAKIKSGESASRKNYRAQLVCERLTGHPQESFTSPAMMWGAEQEPFAKAAYEAQTGELIEEVGFIRHSELGAGASPDGCVGPKGLIETKCPNTATHIETLMHGMSPGHVPQVQGQMWITGREWCDFVSFDPRMPEHMQLYIERIPRDDAYIANLEAEIIRFIAEIEETIEQLTKRAA